ncbi:MAG: hypothetical protein MZV49_02840 [Rhodopseudomonas palustris]|nr:hypothetical protein [Rhodopseudomonas palustris]
MICNCRRRIGGRPSVALSREVLHQGEVREGGANGTRLTVDAVNLDDLLGMTGVRAERRITSTMTRGCAPSW